MSNDREATKNWSHRTTPPEYEDFVAMDFPEPARLLGPILNESIVIGAGGPGSGKTQLAVACAHALCTGRDFLGWRTPKKRSVLFIDGEMSGRQLQDRLNLYSWPDDREPLHLMNSITWAARQSMEPPNLAEPRWQEIVCDWAKGHDVVMLDNVMSLVNVPGQSFSSDEFWRCVNPLNLALRAIGCTAIWWDHTNAEGRPFGTRTKEWGCDLVFTLKENEKSRFYLDCPGVAFTLSFRKVRGVKGKVHRDIDCEMYLGSDSKAVWNWHPRKTDEREKVAELNAQGMTQRQIASELGIALGKVNKLLKTPEGADESPRRRG